MNRNQHLGSSQRLLRHYLKENALWGYILLTLLLGFAYSAINPIHEGTDELRHYRFVQYIIQNKALPVQGQEDCRSQSHHPPLFYMMASAVSFWVDTGQSVCNNPQDNPFWGYRQWEVGTDNKNLYLHQFDEDFPWRGEALAAHLARSVNVLLGGLAVAITWLTARLIWPNNRWMAFGALPLIAFLPQFLYMSGTLNNDIIAAVAGALVCLVSVLLIKRPGPLINPIKWGIIFGAVYSLALMSKFNLAPFGLPLGLVIIYKTLWQSGFHPYSFGRAEKSFVIAGTAMVGTTAVLAGWWFLRNQILYGEPTGFRILTELWGVREASSSWGLLWIELPGIWSSFVGRFGYGQIPLPALVYQISWGLTFFAILGIGVYLFWVLYNHDQMATEKEELAAKSPHLLLLGLVSLIAILVVFAYVLVSPAGAMGRFLFPGLPAFAILIFWGLTRWPILLGWNFDRPLAIGLNIVMLLVALVALFGYLQPAYARPEINVTDRGDQFQTEAVRFEPFVDLINAKASKRIYTPGEAIRLDLTWSVVSKPFGDFYFFVHLIDKETGELIAQRDTQPVTGKFPMHLWQEGDLFNDHIEIQIPETAHPTTAEISIGFYAPVEQYRLAVSDSAGNGLGDSYTVAPVDLIERQGEYPNAQNWNFEGRARLRGYEYSSRSVSTSEPVELTLYWDLLDKSALEQTDVIVLLSGENGETFELTKSFSELMSGSTRGGTAIDSYAINVDGLQEGNLRAISLILIDHFTGERVNMVTARGNWIDNELYLPSVQVR
ncbi:MAG: ArnT family glycosyltransferase [Anaerolineae bacterium]